MFLNNPEYTKEKVKHDCITCWNPSRTLAWPKMGGDIIMGKREGYYFWDIDGKKYMNLHLNGGTFNVGHRNPEVIGAMKEAIEEFDIGNHHFGSVARGYLAKKLVETATEGMQYCIFSSCGGEAVDVAIKSARYATKRRKIVSLMKCYHGHTGLALDCGDNLYKEKFLSGLGDPDFIQVSMDDVDAMELVLKNEDVAGVIIETIPATYGFKIPAPGYIKKVKELCEKYETLYIADEVQTGLMRTGKLWAISHEDVKPDIIVTGKGLSGGIYPISATIMKKKAGLWVEEFGRGHTGTFGGSELGCAVAGKVMDIVTRESTVKNVHFLTDYLKKGLDGVKNLYPDFFTSYTQRGIIFGLNFDYPDGGIAAMKSLCDNGIWAIYARFDPHVVQFKPGLLCTREYCDELLEKFEKGIGEARKNFLG
ncbi:aspartate aminotransferase family protein [Faecalicatena contorta]|uniref:Acetylornithine/succinyldiaminopimelate/putrescine aminotransferase n=1 Tax=Faecalicatena contorta TaxID=39482 RepID=A0A315ZP45_9FIRM|nr:aminotransferase class III-fold pyridoxal phosphate-dependent enzyme [Faecalicatena contorta]PWJ47341.1 acetylornithine/succinyldiaminopimelate/putrescine aminotransferase [Faecalicatena contorta]SUQ16055.1 Acetylornithine/succinyldiaminopimelate/putrescine aminotransferase [Faecalicatena contorta]